MIKVLNLYAGIGGNRKLWTGCDVTAVEIDPLIAIAYQKHFPDDRVVIGDAHEYLLNHYKEFDLIWSSRPCQSHSAIRKNLYVGARGGKPVYPDMGLYEEILFLREYCKCLWAVENVRPFYKPLIEPTVELGRHLIWSNFPIVKAKFAPGLVWKGSITSLQKLHGFDLSFTPMQNKRQILRNCVEPEIGLYVFNQAIANEIRREA